MPVGLLKRGGRHGTEVKSCLFLSGLSSKIDKEPPLELIWLDCRSVLDPLWQRFSLFPKLRRAWEEEKLRYFLLTHTLHVFLMPSPSPLSWLKKPLWWVTIATRFASLLISSSFHLKTKHYLSSEKHQKFSSQNCLDEISQLSFKGLKRISFPTHRNLTPVFVMPSFQKVFQPVSSFEMNKGLHCSPVRYILFN